MRVILTGAGAGAAVGAASLALFYLFGTCGAGAVAVDQKGWQVLLPILGFGALLGAIAGSMAAPAECTSAKVVHFITIVAVAVPAFFLLALIIAHKLGWLR